MVDSIVVLLANGILQAHSCTILMEFCTLKLLLPNMSGTCPSLQIPAALSRHYRHVEITTDWHKDHTWHIIGKLLMVLDSAYVINESACIVCTCDSVCACMCVTVCMCVHCVCTVCALCVHACAISHN